MVQRIDENSENSLVNARKAKGELIKHYDNVSQNRSCILKMFCILIIFSIFWILFVV